MKKSILLLSLTLSLSLSIHAQKKSIEAQFSSQEAIAQFTYLASDALMGRDPIRAEMKLAYTYIAQELEKAGAKPLP